MTMRVSPSSKQQKFWPTTMCSSARFHFGLLAQRAQRTLCMCFLPFRAGQDSVADIGRRPAEWSLVSCCSAPLRSR